MDAQPRLTTTLPRPSFAISRLADLRGKLERLRGLQIDALKTMNLDGLLDDLSTICGDLEDLTQLNSDMGVVDSAMEMLLQLLHAAGEEPLSPQGLHALMQPLQVRHAANWNTLSNLF